MATDLVSGLGRAVLLVDDLDAALGFYRETLGFAVLHDSAAAGVRYLHVGAAGQDGVGVWLLARGDGDPPPAASPALVLYAPDRDAVARRLRDAGAPVWAVADEAGSRSLHTRDPGGNVIVVAELTR